MSGALTGHLPVMVTEVIGALAPRAGALYVDATFGVGGYSAALLEAALCRVVGIDRDPEACARGHELARHYAGRLTVHHGAFSNLEALLAAEQIAAIDGIAFDLGVSSPQIDDAGRGFSFLRDGPLDMRMDPTAPTTAADLVNRTEERRLADILYLYGEERASRRIARAIVAARRVQPITRTAELAEIVRRVLGRAADGIDPATRTFQALRIAVNDELGELSRGLSAAERLLAPGGRLCVVAFHSLEDRRVKTFLAARSGRAGGASRHLPATTRPTPSFRLLSGSAVRPSAAEVAANPRARSARLRAAERTPAAPWPEDFDERKAA